MLAQGVQSSCPHVGAEGDARCTFVRGSPRYWIVRRPRSHELDACAVGSLFVPAAEAFATASQTCDDANDAACRGQGAPV